MKRESHKILGHYLMQQLQVAPAYRHRKAFLFGCTEPDSNPFTYLKGSRTIQWLRGHNYRNAERLMARLSASLSRRERWGMLDYYRLGKLIHYTSDAFTYAHNETFRENIHEHRCYEARLQRCFKTSLALAWGARERRQHAREAVFAAVREAHASYMNTDRSIRTDVEYILRMTEQVFCGLVPEPVKAA